jgi:hypothetical protein
MKACKKSITPTCKTQFLTAWEPNKEKFVTGFHTLKHLFHFPFLANEKDLSNETKYFSSRINNNPNYSYSILSLAFGKANGYLFAKPQRPKPLE